MPSSMRRKIDRKSDLAVSVVILALENLDAAVLNFINQPVLLVNFTAPPASQIPLQGLRVAKPRIAVAVNVGCLTFQLKCRGGWDILIKFPCTFFRKTSNFLLRCKGF